MQNETINRLHILSDDDLLARTRSLIAGQRHATAEIVAHLAELEQRGLHLRAGYTSLFVYCRDALHLSEAEAFNRIEAARAARRFPVILEMLGKGDVHLTTIRLLAPHLTADNHRQVLESARWKRKTEVEEIVAGLAPRPDVPPSVRKLPERRSISRAAEYGNQALQEAAPVNELPGLPGVAGSRAAPVAASSPMANPAKAAPIAPLSPKRAPIEPLSPERYQLKVTIDGATLQKLREVQDLLRHKIPSGDTATVIDRALDALRRELAGAKFAATNLPRPRRPVRGDTRHIPASVKRSVWTRDGGACAFVGSRGHRCGARAFLEFHHIRPYAVGGQATIENIALHCRRHNHHEARVYFARGEVVPEPVRVTDPKKERGPASSGGVSAAARAAG